MNKNKIFLNGKCKTLSDTVITCTERILKETMLTLGAKIRCREYKPTEYRRYMHMGFKEAV